MSFTDALDEHLVQRLVVNRRKLDDTDAGTGRHATELVRMRERDLPRPAHAVA